MPIPRRLLPLQTPLQKTITSYVLETCLDLDLVSSTVFSACRSNKRSLLHINITILFLLPSIDWHTLTFSISSRRATGRRRRTGGGQQRCGTEVLVVFCPPLRMVHFGAARRRRRWASPDVVIGHSGPRLSPVNQWTCFASQKKHWHNYEKCCGGDDGPHYSFSGVWRWIQVEVLYELWWSRRPLVHCSLWVRHRMRKKKVTFTLHLHRNILDQFVQFQQKWICSFTLQEDHLGYSLSCTFRVHWSLTLWIITTNKEFNTVLFTL